MTLKCKIPACNNVRRKGNALCYNCYVSTSKETRDAYDTAYRMWQNGRTDEDVTRLIVAFQAMVQSIK